jgi:hypothetical protein
MNRINASLVSGLVFAVSLVPSAHAVSGCTNALLSGPYGMQFSGNSALAAAHAVGGIPVPVSMSEAAVVPGVAVSPSPTVGIARLYLDGVGTLSGYSAVNLQGVWLQGNVSGAYAVNDDCSMTFTLTDSNGNTQNFGGTIVGHGDHALVLQTDAGTGVSGSLKRVRGSCMPSDVFGSFGMQYAGKTVGQPNGDYSSVGIASADGQGNITATESRYSAGTYSQVSSSGTITVNNDCTAVITLSSSTKSINFLALVGLDPTQIVIVQSDAGTAASGSLVGQ